ncbi:MAG: hypothetical protein K2O08_05765, partial [Clostridia bacterium]|nr:hypothetical protein [Clostridia bacterium]
VLLLVAILLTMSMATLCACGKNEKAREVELELINPTTGDVMKSGDTIDLPEEKTPIEVRVKDKETGEYLTDDDLPEMTLAESWNVNFAFINTEGFTTSQQYIENWPTREYIDSRPYYKEYEIIVFFSCIPKNLQNPEKFKIKYSRHVSYIKFYINKSWRENKD